HRETALAFLEPRHHGAPARPVHAATQQADQQQTERERREPWHIRRPRYDEYREGGERRGRRTEAEQQDLPVAPAIGQQAPWQFAQRDAETEHAEHQPKAAVADVIARADENGRGRNARKRGREARVRREPDAEYFPPMPAAARCGLLCARIAR